MTDRLHAASRDAIRSASRARHGHCFYVTVRDAGRTGFLLGPYPTGSEARSNVKRGQQLAEQANSRACFYAYGTSSAPAEVRTVFGS